MLSKFSKTNGHPEIICKTSIPQKEFFFMKANFLVIIRIKTEANFTCVKNKT